MKIVRNCLVLYLVVTLLVHVLCISEYCLFHGVEYNRADCRPNTVNHTFYTVPVITRSVTHIDLAGQPLKKLSYNAFRNISNQKEFSHLNLGHCEISRISADAFLNLDNLKDLSLAFNKITKFETSTFQHTKKLTYLLASHNQIDKLQAGLFSNLVYLKRISFIHNRITHIDKDTFKNTRSLFYINLRNNKMHYLDPLFKDNFRKVNHLYLGGNPWNCDCNLRELFKIYKVHRPRDEYTEPTCQNPPVLRYIEWFYLTSDTFMCDPRIISPTNDTRMVTEGSTVTLSCKVHGDPKPDIKWSKGSIDIPQDNIVTSSDMDIHYVNYTFTVEEDDLGVYQCIANNTRELRRSSTTLIRDVSKSTVTIPKTVEPTTTVAIHETIELIPTQRKSKKESHPTPVEPIYATTEFQSTTIEPIYATTEFQSTTIEPIYATTEFQSTTIETIYTTTDHISTTTDLIPITTDLIPITTDYVPITTDRISITTDSIPTTTDSIPTTTDHIPTTTDRIPTTTDRITTTTHYAPRTTDRIPITTDRIPTTTDRIPTTTDRITTTTHYAPRTTDRIPATTDRIPITRDRIPVTRDRIPITRDRIPTSTDRIPITTNYAPRTTKRIPPITDRGLRTTESYSTIQEFASTIEINEPLITFKESGTAIRELISTTTEPDSMTTVEVKMNVVLQLPTTISWQDNVHIKPLHVVPRTNQTSADG